ncbi:tetratricopeptide repeat protein [Marinomonas mediterranea]|jgi:FOG: TPR repeat, SEL1 subfamily|uniref:Sel1 domain protein repeat-containing protein n=1 Tax=Marinomonas mediterranea (strain ATCC 700492 / JCM 21426 / NBRC 103028 / MMB-1) TaxID=717774 RepID=F2K1M9_MARM1|nr:tetratricopeptide repeat protein [Marinomonas mediterranea]ADZ92259.1 Sel1 domain protein repeat-containing protein [Marinomonas mediterranea MMB-1]WCN18316.1 hypothetical protein GV053_15380 [Marinomonas mediterranea MMB-1]
MHFQLINYFNSLKGKIHFFIYAGFDGNIDKVAIPNLLKAAELGHIRGQSELGTRYLTGELLKKNYDEAQKWLELASRKGNAFAMRNLACIYYYGLNGEQSYEKAFEWWSTAAHKGDPVCQCYIAEMYQEGVGVQEDIMKAIDWFKKSAEQGHIPAREALDEIFSQSKKD